MQFIKELGHSFLVGTGFLADAYDLFIINIVMTIMSDIYTISDFEKSLISSVALFGAMVGQLFFGTLADRIGRRIIFIATITMITLGTIASALAFNIGPFSIFYVLAIFRLILGIGIGGEYPLSATIAHETAKKGERSRKTATIFSMQGLGILLASVMGYIFVITLPSLDYAWRASLGFAAIPGVAMFFFRIKMEETPDFKQIKSTNSGLSVTEIFRKIFREHKLRLFGTSVTWFLLDIVFYANGLFTTTILKKYTNSLDSNIEMNILLAAIGLWGYYAAIFVVKYTRKYLQLFGFISMGVTYIIIGIFSAQLLRSKIIFIILYGITFFLSNMGPNTTTYILATESFPATIRSTCSGISAALGKLGAVVGAYGMSPILDAYDLKTVFIICGIISFAGAIVTIFCVRDFHEMEHSLTEDVERVDPGINQKLEVEGEKLLK